MPLVSPGGSCGKPAFLVPHLTSWNDETTLLESVGQEVAAVQDWSDMAMVFIRPGHGRGEGLLVCLRDALRPAPADA